MYTCIQDIVYMFSKDLQQRLNFRANIKVNCTSFFKNPRISKKSTIHENCPPQN